MRAKRTLSLIAAAVTVTALAAVGATLVTGTDKKPPPKTGFIQGKVTSGDRHPEAGVWVIAETADLPTPYRKIVVTDDRGRFVVPELPEADYQVWVRGYGLLDSAKVPATVERKGKARVAIETEVATTPQEAAADLPGELLAVALQAAREHAACRAGATHAWVSDFKLGCQLCHQIGSASARGMRGNRAGLDAGLKKAGVMDATAMGLGRDAAARRARRLGRPHRGGEIAGGAAAAEGHRAQPRHHAVGLGRHVYTYAHDEIATDKRNPTLYANGPIYGVDLGNDRLLSVDPVTTRGRRDAARAHGRRLQHAVVHTQRAERRSSRSALPPRAA